MSLSLGHLETNIAFTGLWADLYFLSLSLDEGEEETKKEEEEVISLVLPYNGYPEKETYLGPLKT